MTLRWTEGELQAIRNRQQGWLKPPPVSQVPKPAQAAPKRPLKPKKVRAPVKPKGMNKTEEAFSHVLTQRQQAGELKWWGFEPFRIRLADGCFYRPDFVTVDASGRTAVYEVKGHMREAARVRLRVAAEKLPYPFYLVRKADKELLVTPV